MQESVTPKVILNEEYLDLRNHPGTSLINKKSSTKTHTKDNTSRVSNLKSEGLRFEKELINCGLKRLVTSYNATIKLQPQKLNLNMKKVMRTKQKSMGDPRFRRFVVPEEKSCLKSHSEISVIPRKTCIEQTCTSAPLVHSKRTTDITIENIKRREEPQKDKGTMTRIERLKGHVLKPKKNYKRKALQKHSQSKVYKDDYHLDPRLYEKYSVLKMPWKRSWTSPIFSPKCNALDKSSDRQTYLYDDGTEVDSLYIDEKQKIFSREIGNQCLALLFLGGSICGIILVSLLIWFIFGNDFLHIIFKPREIHEGAIKRHIKYVGGSIIYIITNFFTTLGRVLAIPTQQVYQSQMDYYRWPPAQFHRQH